jgi:hypothetical protein
MKMYKSRIILHASAGVGNEGSMDVTEIYEESGCDNVDDFMENCAHDLLGHARDMVEFEWYCKKDGEGE